MCVEVGGVITILDKLHPGEGGVTAIQAHGEAIQV